MLLVLIVYRNEKLVMHIAGKEFCAKVWSIPGEGRFLKEEVSLELTGDRINGVSWKPNNLVVVSASQAAVHDLTAEGKVKHC